MPLGDLLLDSELDDGAIFKYFWCPGCEKFHGFQLNENLDPHWSFNGDSTNPTFSPALRVKNEKRQTVCHLQIKNGMIMYAEDCKHIFAGMTISMAEA